MRTIIRFVVIQYYAIDDVYEIELFYRFKNPVWGYDMEKSAGRFRCGSPACNNSAYHNPVRSYTNVRYIFAHPLH